MLFAANVTNLMNDSELAIQISFFGKEQTGVAIAQKSEVVADGMLVHRLPQGANECRNQ